MLSGEEADRRGDVVQGRLPRRPADVVVAACSGGRSSVGECFEVVPAPREITGSDARHKGAASNTVVAAFPLGVGGLKLLPVDLALRFAESSRPQLRVGRELVHSSDGLAAFDEHLFRPRAARALEQVHDPIGK